MEIHEAICCPFDLYVAGELFLAVDLWDTSSHYVEEAICIVPVNLQEPLGRSVLHVGQDHGWRVVWALLIHAHEG